MPEENMQIQSNLTSLSSWMKTIDSMKEHMVEKYNFVTFFHFTLWQQINIGSHSETILQEWKKRMWVEIYQK